MAENEMVNQSISARVAEANFGLDLLRKGETVVALDEDGRVNEHRPDGSATILHESEDDPAVDDDVEVR